jgi:glutathione S-transferase
MILIGQYDSPYVRRVAVALGHYGLPYEHRPWSVWANAEDIAPFNPLRRVPVLVLGDGESLVESAAILDALDEMVGPDRALVPRSGPTRRAVLRVCALATGLADKAVSLFYEGVLRDDAGRSAVWVERCRAQIRDTLALLESERAATGDWWTEGFTHADVALTCALRFTSEALPSIWNERDHPRLAAGARRCESLPIFQRAFQPLQVSVRR